MTDISAAMDLVGQGGMLEKEVSKLMDNRMVAISFRRAYDAAVLGQQQTPALWVWLQNHLCEMVGT